MPSGPLRSDTGRPVVHLHIGAMKTGTTYVQQLLYANREQLRGAGLVVPGKDWGRQVRGVQDVMRLGRRDRHIRRMSAGVWQDLLGEALAEPSHVSLISVEFLSFAGRRAAARVLEALEGADVRVILGVRDMAGMLPSQWQTLVHNSGKVTWPDYLDGIPEPRVRPAPFVGRLGRSREEFHRTMNVPRMIDAWRTHLPAEHLHVVTVPRKAARPDELWQRFAGIMGVDPDAVTQPPEDTNPSLGHASSELVRRVNVQLGRLPQSEYNWTVKEPVALEVLARRAREENRAQLTRAAYDRALAWNALTRESIEASGAVLTGDLDDLPVVPDVDLRASLPDAPREPGTTEMLDAAEDAADAFARLTERRVRKLAKAGVEVQPVPRSTGRKLRPVWETAESPVDAAAADLADRAREGARLLRDIRQLRRQGRPV